MEQEGSIFEELKLHLMLNGDGEGLKLLKQYKRERDEDVDEAVGYAMEERNKRFLIEQDLLHLESGANLVRYAESVVVQKEDK